MFLEISGDGMFCLGAEPCSPKPLLKVCLLQLLSNLKLKLECEARFKSFIIFFYPPNTQTSSVQLLKKNLSPSSAVKEPFSAHVNNKSVERVKGYFSKLSYRFVKQFN